MTTQRDGQSLWGNTEPIVNSAYTQVSDKVFPTNTPWEKRESFYLQGVPIIILFQITVLFREDTLS